jgi:uncharacterized protein YyaL (SSP411 family)
MSLKNEKSLYLKQHQDQPINWKSWNDKTWKEIKQSNKCVFISIGYSSCHWCHVMAHESFENQDVAEFMNEHFISIKIDREEFPDVDHYYQRAANYMGKNGGWPLSVFLSPQMTPLFIGTYFPLTDRPNLPSFLTLAKEIHTRFHDPQHKAAMEEQGAKLIEQLSKRHKVGDAPKFEGHFPSANQILHALDQYADKQWGGFGKAPKFPQFAFYESMLEQILEGVVEKEKAESIIHTVERMNMGGIYDHAKGGIHRYSTDEKWLVPHFEKMLYDQAGFLRLLVKTSLIYPSPLIIDSIIQTLDYLNTEMLGVEGYFFAAQDADSEGKEGLYFTFLQEEFEDALNRFDETLLENHAEKIASWFQISNEGNFEGGLNVISLNFQMKDDFYQPENWNIIRKVKTAVLQERKKRVPPATDQKGICSWNYMLVSSLIDVIQYSRVEQVKARAQELLKKSLKGIHHTFVKKVSEERIELSHSTTLNNQIIFFEDYVFFAEANYKLYQLTGDQTYLELCKKSLTSIENLFSTEDEIFERPCSMDAIIGNPHASFQDQSYSSAICVWLMIKHKVGLHDQTEGQSLSPLWQKMKAQSRDHALVNPLAMGEAMKFLIYPEHAFKRVEIPANWKEKNEFLQLMPHFSSRFVIKYELSRVNDQSWQICRHDACEISDKGLEVFVQTLFKKDK